MNCPICDSYGIITESQSNGEYQEIDVGNTEKICGVLCADCSAAGIDQEAAV